MQTLDGFEFVAFLVYGSPLLADLMTALAVFAHEIAAVDIVKGELPASFDFEIHGPPRGCVPEQQRYGQKYNSPFSHCLLLRKNFQPSRMQRP